MAGSPRPADRARGLVGVAAGGVVLGHILGYLLAFPDGAGRHAHLVAAGHGSFHLLGSLSLAASALSLIALGVRSLGGEALPGCGGTALVLGGLQVPAYLLLELIERRLDLPATFADPGVLVGLLMQVVVAASLAVLLRAFVRAVRSVAAMLRPRRTGQPVQGCAAPPVLLRAGTDLLVGARGRAPPAHLPS